ncbi:MAG TPA: hypothetical protein PKE64_20740 [Anaerolineae bacterium]|nr:hypothetical protein [Anaerolineae bacterium]HMR66447.1 hypothetical protein [Anaerolineae bacterium]
MSKPAMTQEKRIHLSQEQAQRLSALAQSRQMSEDQIIEKALNIIFNLAEIIEAGQFWQKIDRINDYPDLSKTGTKPTHLKERQAEYQFKQALVDLGLLEEIRDVASISTIDASAPMPVSGKPLSELIIEERR